LKKDKLILIGASTGGPGHLKKLLKNFNNTNVPIVIAQHMNEIFIPSFSSQLSTEVGVSVTLVSGEVELKNGIYVCEKTSSIKLNESLKISNIDFDTSPSIFNPNVDNLFISASLLTHKLDILAILLTGIGNDGALGLKALYEAGAKCFGESEQSAIVYGMPKKAKELNSDLKMLTLEEIKIEMEKFTNVFL
jgi:two-component system chemotaxis response regulator CheB